MASSKLKRIEFKRMLKRYESALEDLEYLREMVSEINSEFSSALAAKKRQDLFESKDVEALAKKEDIEKENPDRDPIFKKLFRKIVVKCHPDKMDKNLSIKQKAEYIDLYELANQANGENNMALLITVAIKLEIELDEEYFEHVESISEESKSVEKEIEGIQNSIAWCWYHTDVERRDMLLNNYISHMENILLGNNKIKKNILGIGHPRTGTGYTHNIMKSWGLDVGHERMEADGIIAWQLVDNNGPWPFIDTVKLNDAYKWGTIIYNIRDPKDSIPSIVLSESKNESSVEFRSKSLNINLAGNKVEAAIQSILEFDKLIIARKPDFIYRIEDQSEDLFNFLKSRGLNVQWNDTEIGKKYNARNHSGLESIRDDLNSVRPSLKKRINTFCINNGYNPLF